MSGERFAAVDLGASSGRVIVGEIAPDRIETEAVHRFPNRPVRTPDGLKFARRLCVYDSEMVLNSLIYPV